LFIVTNVYAFGMKMVNVPGRNSLPVMLHSTLEKHWVDRQFVLI